MFVIFCQNSKQTKFSESPDFLRALRIFVFVTDYSSNFVFPGNLSRFFSNFRKVHTSAGFPISVSFGGTDYIEQNRKTAWIRKCAAKAGYILFRIFSQICFRPRWECLKIYACPLPYSYGFARSQMHGGWDEWLHAQWTKQNRYCSLEPPPPFANGDVHVCLRHCLYICQIS